MPRLVPSRNAARYPLHQIHLSLPENNTLFLGKLQRLGSLLRDLFLYKHRCLIFTQMSKMLDVLQAFLSFHGYQYFRLDGATPIEQRQVGSQTPIVAFCREISSLQCKKI